MNYLYLMMICLYSYHIHNTSKVFLKFDIQSSLNETYIIKWLEIIIWYILKICKKFFKRQKWTLERSKRQNVNLLQFTVFQAEKKIVSVKTGKIEAWIKLFCTAKITRSDALASKYKSHLNHLFKGICEFFYIRSSCPTGFLPLRAIERH